ncbi:MAG: hypothetical protein JWN70_2028 [Planctomycetaceae bacterium]|nr:hypothetical protein [Planctomycetaceae bacterium]
MLGRLITFVATATATVLVLGACITPFFPTVIAIMVAGSELHTMRDTGLPSSVNVLQWTEWRPGDGRIYWTDYSPNSGKLQDAKIVAYRIGHARGLLSKFTFYQARYALADGTEVIAPANGPIPLISSWIPGVIGMTSLQLAVSALMFVWVTRRSGQEAISQDITGAFETGDL